MGTPKLRLRCWSPKDELLVRELHRLRVFATRDGWSFEVEHG